ncbi:cellulose biosynthesis protein BcsN [Devosia sediminis]|uniref:Cellulose biosynthesis protein BcsN n=1 Tax=Devosia sediminis TaxID=2798801 RepID=A0A934J2I2_9HYPH|nr:cellulose biosynthesis protein BcsN [Devosia sediminis]MBJ3786479.1 cellulose biosynthesis protein BcsN [Devosia sediminis]
MAALGMAAGLAACSSTAELPPQEARVTSPADALIMPPPGGPGIVSVVSIIYSNARHQDIYLETNARSTGENKISVTQFIGKGGDGSDSRLRDVPFTEVNLTEAALAAWPGSGMSVSPYFVQNNYGPFGYAIAKPANGDTCIYAWQRIEPTLKPSGAVDRGAISIRLQLCRRDTSEARLLEIMYQLRLNIAVFPPAGAPAIIGARMAPVRPVGQAGFVEVIPPAPAAPARPAAVRSAAVTPATPTASTVVPPPGAPIVPPPGGSTGASSGTAVPRPPSTSTPPSGSDVTVPSPPSGGN